jgi:hypothetical protein
MDRIQFPEGAENFLLLRTPSDALGPYLQLISGKRSDRETNNSRSSSIEVNPFHASFYVFYHYISTVIYNFYNCKIRNN